LLAKKLTVLDASVTYYEGGDPQNPTVVLLHGGGIDHALLAWDDLIPSLLFAGYHVLAPDLPGHGDSPSVDVTEQASDPFDCVGEMMAAWQVEQAVFVGVLSGATLALRYALEHPERVERLVLVGSAGLADEHAWPPLRRGLRTVLGLDGLPWWAVARSQRVARGVVSWLVRPDSPGFDRVLRQVREAAKQATDGPPTAFFDLDADSTPQGGGRAPSLAKLSMPVLLIHGASDPVVPVSAAARLADELPNAHLEVFEGGRHWVQRENPKRFNLVVQGFLHKPENE
jgi:pimeloyl-ACP methyl ester carboxylesterase